MPGDWKYRKAATDTMNASGRIPLIHTDSLIDTIPFGCIPIAVELTDDAESIIEFQHPKRAFYIFGPKDGSIGKSITKSCKQTIYIPTTSCMNLAATVHVVLYDRLLKESLNDKRLQ